VRGEAQYRTTLLARGVPAHLHEDLLRYFIHRILPQGFLLAVLENDLLNAIALSDANSRLALFELLIFLAEDVPVGSWGSPAAVAEWAAGSSHDENWFGPDRA
jgi:uncharacterized MnhB-related membrane protein